MSDSRPFGSDTLKLQAIFVPEGNPAQVTPADIDFELGTGALRIPAVIVPEGSNAQPPGYPYRNFGQFEWREAEPIPGQVQPPRGRVELPRGQGADDEDGAQPAQSRPRPMPPTPSFEQMPRYVDVMKGAIGALRALYRRPPAKRPVDAPNDDSAPK